MASTLGTHNPLRYRGYVFDQETGLYYLQSRYYDPEMGRFINADAYTSTGQGILGNNMFVYCNNNPVILTDSSGCAACVCINDEVDMLDAPWRNAGGGGGSSFRRTKNIYTQEKLVDVLSALYNSLELSIGVGLGYYGSCDIIDLVGIEGGFAGDLFVLKLQDGSFTIGQEVTSSMKATLFFYNFGYEETSFNRIGEPAIIVPTTGVWSEDTWTLFSAGVYFIAGGSYRIGFDQISFINALDEVIFEE